MIQALGRQDQNIFTRGRPTVPRPNTYSGNIGFGNAYSPPSIMENPQRNLDFYGRGNPGATPVQPNAAYQPFINTAQDRSAALWKQAQGNQPDLNWAPQDWESYSRMTGGAYPTLRSYKGYPTAADAQPWMENLSGGMRSTLDDLVRRQAGAGISRGGMGVAGGIPLDSSGRLDAMKALASKYGDIFNQGMGYAKSAADYDRQSALDTFGAEARGADAMRSQLAQFLGLKGTQAGQQLSKYGADIGASLSQQGQGLSALTAGLGQSNLERGAQQGAWDKDVQWDRQLMAQFPWLSSVLGGDNQAPAGQLTGGKGPTVTGPARPDANVIRNMDEGRGGQKNAASQAAAQQKQLQDQIDEFLRRYKTDEQFGRHSFNYSPYDRFMATLMGTPLEAQNKVNYGQDSKTSAGTSSSILLGPKG